MPHTRDLALQGREAHGRGAQSREAGRDIVIDRRNRSEELEKVRLARSEMDTIEPEPTQTDVTDQHA